MTHQELIAALEKATGPDRELDIRIGQATAVEGWRVLDDGSIEFWTPQDSEFGEGWMTAFCELPPYTASIDAAMGLVPEHSDYDFGSAKLVGTFWALVIDPDNEHKAKGCKSQAIAICIAALRARSKTEGQ